MSLKRYLNAASDTPFIIDTGESSIELPNMNSLKLSQILEIFERASSPGLRFLDGYLTPNQIVNLTANEKVAILKRWQDYSMIDLSEFAQLKAIIDDYSRELTWDLRKFLNISIFDFLDLKVVESIDIIIMLGKQTDSHVVSSAMGWKYPFTMESFILSDIKRMISMVFTRNKQKDDPRLPFTDKTNSNTLSDAITDDDKQISQSEVDDWVEQRRKAVLNGRK